MNFDTVLFAFLDMAWREPRFSPAHISLFVAILHESCQQNTDPISIYARDLMKKSKIAGTATYYRIIKELQEFGFIRYEPSYNPLFGSSIYIVKK